MTTDNQIYALLTELAGIDTHETNLRDQPAAYAAVEKFLGLCQDEGCPHHGSKHVCVSNPQAQVVGAERGTLVSPMAKMAKALREKAENERAEFDRRVQSGEWGPMPEADASPVHVAEIEGDDAVRTLRWSRLVGAFDYPVGTKLYAFPPSEQEGQ